jgi:hypothetical protein
MESIKCVGRFGLVNDFLLQADAEIENYKNHSNFIYRIYSKDKFDENVFFEITLSITDSNIAIITMMNHHQIPEFSQKGIPDFIIPWLYNKHKLRIHSSTNCTSNKFFEEEKQESLATKVWDRLIGKGIASFDNTTNRYFYDE